MNENELMIDEEMPEDPFFEIQTKQDVDDIINKLDGQLMKIYEMNMLLNQRKTEIGKSGARITSKRKIKGKNFLGKPGSSIISLSERIIGNFNIRKRKQSEMANNLNRRRRKRYLR